MPTTLKDIARETGLSTATISLVLNNKPCKIPQSTRNLVIETAKRLRYSPNQLAVGLVQKKTNTIGVIIPNIGNPFFSQMIFGIDDEAYKNGYTTMIRNTSDSAFRDISCLKDFISRRVDAIIIALASECDDQKTMKQYHQIIDHSPIPIIMIDRYNPQFDCSSIALDHQKSGYLAANYLISLGHKRIAHIHAALGVYSANSRLNGIKLAFMEHNLPYHKEDEYHLSDPPELDNPPFAEQIAKTAVTAVFALNDEIAFDICDQFLKMGIQIPNDISVMGFNNIKFSDQFKIPLTTISHPAYEMGRAALRQTIAEISDQNTEKQRILFDPKLIIRESTANCPQK